jgi:hypothetical protein
MMPQDDQREGRPWSRFNLAICDFGPSDLHSEYDITGTCHMCGDVIHWDRRIQLPAMVVLVCPSCIQLTLYGMVPKSLPWLRWRDRRN